MKSIPLGSYRDILNPEEFPSSESDVSKMENLIYQERMSDDNFSNHKYGAVCSYAYNNRLHLANVKTTFFKGFNPDYFLWYNSADTADGNYNGYKYKDAPGGLYSSIIFEIEINTGITNEKVYRSLASPMMWGIYKMFMSGFISYPDPRAKRLTIYRYSDSQWYRVFSQPLEKHNSLSLAFYVNDGLNPVVESDAPISVALPDTSKIISLTEPNKIKVSELNNPLNFPNANVYQAGNGTILARSKKLLINLDVMSNPNLNKLVKGKNTKPEILLRKYLFSQGFRYRINVKNIVGSPDVVFKKYKTVIFVNGCFWHAHEGCKIFKFPNTNTEYWKNKITKNVERDKKVKQTLISQGWNIITIWECMLQKKNRERTFNDLSLLLSKIIIETYKKTNK